MTVDLLLIMLATISTALAMLCRPRWRYRLRDWKGPICIVCGYDLHGTQSQCPECGKKGSAVTSAYLRRRRIAFVGAAVVSVGSCFVIAWRAHSWRDRVPISWLVASLNWSLFDDAATQVELRHRADRVPAGVFFTNNLCLQIDDMLHSEHVLVVERALAMLTITNWQNSAIKAQVIRLLAHADPGVRAAAMTAVNYGPFKPVEAQELFLKLLYDSDSIVAMLAIAKLRPPQPDALTVVGNICRSIAMHKEQDPIVATGIEALRAWLASDVGRNVIASDLPPAEAFPAGTARDSVRALFSELSER